MLVRTTPRQTARTAFSLMEMLVVVAIIVALMGIGGYYYFAQLDKAKDNTALTQVKTTLSQAVANYRVDYGDWPQSLQVLLMRGDQGGPYIESEEWLYDPWGHPYQYNPQGARNNGMKPDIWSEGGGRGQVGNWPKGR